MPRRGDAGRDRGEAIERNIDRKLGRLDVLGERIEKGFGEVNEKLDALAAALTVLMRAATQENGNMPSSEGDALVAKVTAKKTLWDGLLAARDALEAKLTEALNAPGMGDTNAKIQEAMDMLDTFVDPKAGTSPILEGTPAAGEQPAEAGTGTAAGEGA